MNKKLFSNTILYTIGEIIPRIISFLLMPIFTRYLMPADYGIISYTNSVIAFIYVFCTLALNTYVLRFFFECKSAEEEKKILGNIFVFIVLVNVVVLVILNMVGPKIIYAAHITVAWNPYFRMAVFNNFLESFSIIPLVFYRVKQNVKSFVGISLSRCIIQYAVTYVMLVDFDMGVLSQYYGRLVTLLPFSFLYIFIMLRNSKLCLDFTQVKKALKFSLPLVPGLISYLALTCFDKVLLERYVPLETIGIYNIAYTIAFATNMIIYSFYRALEPDIFQRYKENIDQDFISYLSRINNIYNYILYALVIGLSLFSKEALIIVASKNYYSAAFFVPFVLVGVVFSGRNSLIQCILTAEKRSVISGIGTMIGAVLCVIINVILIPKIGVIGAPISLSVSYMIMNIYFKLCIRIKFFNNFKDVVAMIIFIIISIFPLKYYNLSELNNIGLKISLYVISMTLLFFNFNVIDFIHISYKRK